jgi:hypothetical protein
MQVYTAPHRSGTFSVMQVSNHLVCAYDSRYRTGKRYATIPLPHVEWSELPVLAWAYSNLRRQQMSIHRFTPLSIDCMQVPAHLDEPNTLELRHCTPLPDLQDTQN